MNDGAIEYLPWLREYELSDPEPYPMRFVYNRFEHRDVEGKLRAGKEYVSYHDGDNQKHMEWHRRMTDQFMQRNEIP